MPCGRSKRTIKAVHGAATAAIRKAWLDHLLLRFRDQKLSDPQLLAFSRHFGELDPPGPNPYGKPFLPEHPEMNVISNIKADGVPIGGTGWYAPTRRPGARPSSSGGGATAISWVSSLPRAKRCSTRYGRMRRGRSSRFGSNGRSETC